MLGTRPSPTVPSHSAACATALAVFQSLVQNGSEIIVNICLFPFRFLKPDSSLYPPEVQDPFPKDQCSRLIVPGVYFKLRTNFPLFSVTLVTAKRYRYSVFYF